MNESDLREVLGSLAGMIRQLGWEGLIDQPVTPSDALVYDTDSRLEARRLVTELQRVVGGLSELEFGILASDEEVHSISFKPDLDGQDSKVERGFVLTRDQRLGRRQVLANLDRNLRMLGGLVDADD